MFTRFTLPAAFPAVSQAVYCCGVGTPELFESWLNLHPSPYVHLSSYLLKCALQGLPLHAARYFFSRSARLSLSPFCLSVFFAAAFAAASATLVVASAASSCSIFLSFSCVARTAITWPGSCARSTFCRGLFALMPRPRFFISLITSSSFTGCVCRIAVIAD